MASCQSKTYASGEQTRHVPPTVQLYSRQKVKDLLEVESINHFLFPWQLDNKFRKLTIKWRWVNMGSDDSEGDKVMCRDG